MKNFIKCTNCGCTDFVKVELESTNIFEIGVVRIIGINAYACKRCGHIELFQQGLDAYEKELGEIAEQKKKQEDEAKKRKIDELKKKIKETQAIIDDLNSTQKQVIEAKEQLTKLKKEYRALTGIPYVIGSITQGA